MRFALVALASLLLMSASESAIEADNHCSAVVAEEKQQKELLLDAVKNYGRCIRNDENSTQCLEKYDKMSVIYSDYRSSTLDFVQGCYLTEH